MNPRHRTLSSIRIPLPCHTWSVQHRSGRGARDPAHRGVLRRVPAPEERGGDRRPPERARPPDSHGGQAPLPDDPETIVPVSFMAHEIKPQPRPNASCRTSSSGCAAASSSTAAGSCISGLAARAATGAGRALPRPDRGAGSLGPRLPASTSSSPRPRTRFYNMRAVLDALRFDVVSYYEPHADNRESKVYEQAAQLGDAGASPASQCGLRERE